MQQSRPVSPQYKWWVVFMLWGVCFFNYADRQAIYSVFPKLSGEFALDKVQLGFIGSAFMWIYAAGAPLAGFIGDRFQRKKLILGGFAFWSVITIMTGWCSRFWHFVTMRALEGFGETFYFPASMSLVSDYHNSRTRSRALSFHQSSVYVGTIAGSWLGAWFAEYRGWRSGFYFFGIAGVLLAIALWRFLREPGRGEADAPEPGADSKPLSLKEARSVIFSRPMVIMLMAVFMAANFVATIFLTWTPTFLVEKFHFRLTTAGFSAAMFIHLASAISAPLGGMLADSFSQRFSGGRMLVQAIGLTAGSAFVFLIGTTADVATLLTAMACFGFCKGLYDSNIFASLYDAVEPRARATAAGVMNTVGWGGGALGPVVVGAFSKYGRGASEMDNMSKAIAYCGVIYLIGAALLAITIIFFARRDILRSKEGQTVAVSRSVGL